MEEIYELDVKCILTIVTVSADCTCAYNIGQREWQAKIGKIPLVVA